MRKFVFRLTIGVVLLSCLVMTAFAVPPNEWHLGGDYDVMTNFQGIIVPSGTTVTAWAGTTDPSVVAVTFHWKYPNGTVLTTDVVGTFTTEMYDGKTVYVFESTFTPAYVGDGSVQAHFQGEDGRTIHDVADVVAMRAVSFNTIPEIQLGTIGAAAAMIAALGLFVIKKRRAVRAAQ